VREFLVSKQITVLKHPPYSSALAPSDFLLFPNVKENIERKAFNDTDEIRINMTAALEGHYAKPVPNYFERWTRRWHQCIASQVEYFEGEHSDIQQ
jgi:hypothetical protein